MQNILITGGCGYIGSHTALCFLKNTNKNIVVVDNLSTGFRQNFDFLDKKFPGRLSLIEQDLKDVKSLEKLFKEKNFEMILHFAGALSVEESMRLPLFYYQNNTANTLSLTHLCVQYNVKKFIFSSTAAVYGEPANEDGITEDAPISPINAYGASKAMSERILQDSAKVSGLRVGILRYFNVAGANMDNDFKKGALGQRSKIATHLIKIATECASGKREKMAIFGTDYPTPDGTCIRDYIHIDDLASAHLQVADFLNSLNPAESEIFNVGYGRGYSVKEVVDLVKKVTQKDFVVTLQGRRSGDPAKLIANANKIRAKTRWTPKFASLEAIIKSAYVWECYLNSM